MVFDNVALDKAGAVCHASHTVDTKANVPLRIIDGSDTVPWIS